MIAKKIKARTDWIYQRRFLAKKIERRLPPNWDWSYYEKHFYRTDDDYAHYVSVSAQHRDQIFKATQPLANKLLGFQRPWWYFSRAFYISHSSPPAHPPGWFRPRSYRYRLRADIHDSARRYVRNPEKEAWIFGYYSEDHPQWFAQFNAEVARQEKILAKERQLKAS